MSEYSPHYDNLRHRVVEIRSGLDKIKSKYPSIEKELSAIIVKDYDFKKAIKDFKFLSKLLEVNEGLLKICQKGRRKK